MKSGGISFAFAKATEGQNFIDTQFSNNMANAKAAGVLIAPYHFARPDSNNTNADTDSANEAHDFVAAISSYYTGTNLTMRPVLDLEHLSNTANEATYLTEWTKNFAKYVHDNLGVDIMIYVNRDFAQHYLTGVSQYPLWIAKPISQSASAATQNDFSQASPPVNSELGAWNTAGYAFWQWSWGGNVGGENPVDRDAFNGSMQQLSAYIPDFHPGDFDNNLVVDARDYVKWRKTMGQTVNPGTGADANFSGTIDAGDYALWRANFGKTYAAGAGGSLGSSEAPEPTTAALVFIGAASLLARRAHGPRSMRG